MADDANGVKTPMDSEFDNDSSYHNFGNVRRDQSLSRDVSYSANTGITDQSSLIRDFKKNSQDNIVTKGGYSEHNGSIYTQSTDISNENSANTNTSNKNNHNDNDNDDKLKTIGSGSELNLSTSKENAVNNNDNDNDNDFDDNEMMTIG